MAPASQADASAVPPECMGYVQQPTVSDRHIVFVAEDDLWVVERAPGGTGRPRRLTNLRGAYCPVLCPDGDNIAFSVASDIWVLTLRDARPRRLTWFGDGSARAVAWTPRGGAGSEQAVVISSTCDDPHARPLLYSVPLCGGQPQLLYEGEYDALVYQPGGSGLCLCRHTCDPVNNSRWKSYRGGKSGFVWLDQTGGGAFTRVPLQDKEAQDLNVSCVMWLKDRLWFVADPEGSGNLWSVDLSGQDLTRHTDHDLFDVRNASGAGGAVAYTCGGDLWLLQAGDGAAQKVALDFGAPLSHMPQFVDAEEACDAVLLHPDGHHCAVLARGRAFELPLWQGPAVPLRAEGAPPAGRAVRCVAMEYLYSGRLLTVTDESMPLPSFTIHPSACMADDTRPTKAQDWINLLVSDAGLGGQRVVPEKAFGNILEMVCSPAHDALLVITGRYELLLVEFVPEVGDRPNPQKEPNAKAELPLRLEVKKLDSSEWEEGISEPCWSPDGEWAAYVHKDCRRGAAIVLMRLDTGERHIVADSSFQNYGPCFDASGRFLSFFSSRTFAPLEDDVTTDLGFPCGSDMPYLVLLQKDAQNPFHRPALSPAELRDREDDGAGAGEAGEEGEEDDEEGSDEGAGDEDKFQPPEQIQVDIEGLAQRILQFPLPFGKYSSGAWTDSGKFLYLRGVSLARQPCADGDDEEDEECPCTLFAYNFSRFKEEKLAEHVQDFSLSMDLRNMLVNTKEPGPDGEEEYRAHVAGEKLPGTGDDDDEDADLDSPGPESGILDLGSRISLEVIPVEEWAQIFEETCEHVRENFFDEELGGVDWDDTCRRYRAVLPRLRSRYELSDLLAELLAELGASHMSVADPEAGEDTGTSLLGSQGHLGLQASWQEIPGAGGAYRVDGLAEGDPWDIRYSGPLARPGVGIALGSYIIAVNRVRVCKEVSLEQMLANFSNCEVLLTCVPPDQAQRFAQVQGMLHKSGGMDGFRRLTATQRKALEAGQGGQDPKSRKKKKKKDKKPRKNDAAALQIEAEKKLASTLSALGIDVADGPIWRTVRVRAADAKTRRNAALRDIVEARLRKVHEATGGRVGYVHVPDTCELGFAEFYRYFGRQCDKEALIVDLRCNGGGYATELILKQLRNVPIGWSVARQGRGRPQVSPELCTQGCMVLLIDENTSSDGECWAEAFRRFGLGKVVGMRTWGGVCAVGGADLELVDGGCVVIPYQHWFVPGAGFGLENRGAEPDVVVEWPPAKPAAGAAAQDQDPQLAEAIRQAQDLLAASAAMPEIPKKFPASRLRRARQAAAGPAAQ